MQIIFKAIIIITVFAFPIFSQTQDSVLNRAKQIKDSIAPVQEINLNSLQASANISSKLSNNNDQNVSILIGNSYLYRAGSSIKTAIFTSFIASGSFLIAGLIQRQNKTPGFDVVLDVAGICCSIVSIGSLWRAGDNLQKAARH